MAGPLAARIQAKKEGPPPEPLKPDAKQRKQMPKKDTAKKKDPFRHRLRMFNGFDEIGFHPTLELRLKRDDSGGIIGIVQMWRKRQSDDFEWRDVRDFNVVLDNIPTPRPSTDDVRGVSTEVQTEPLTSEQHNES